MLKNTVSVLFVTALTALAIFAFIQVAVVITGDQTSTVALASTASAAEAAGSTSQQTGTMTCPRTGCTASTCHGAEGLPPPGR